MHDQVTSFLTRVRKFLTDPTHWARGWYSFDANKLQVAPDSPLAVSFCLMGACYRESQLPTSREEAYREAVSRIRQAIPPAMVMCNKDTIPGFNDNPKTTHADILQVLDAAIALP